MPTKLALSAKGHTMTAHCLFLLQTWARIVFTCLMISLKRRFVTHENYMKFKLVSINKVLLEYSHTHSLCILWLFLHNKGLSSCTKDHLAHKALNIYYLALQKKFASPCSSRKVENKWQKKRAIVLWGFNRGETTLNWKYQKRCSFLEKVNGPWITGRGGKGHSRQRKSRLHTREVGKHYVWARWEVCLTVRHFLSEGKIRYKHF